MKRPITIDGEERLIDIRATGEDSMSELRHRGVVRPEWR